MDNKEIINNTKQSNKKNWFKNNYKFLLVIILYILYQSNFLLILLEEYGIKINALSRTPRILCYTLMDLVYVVILVLMFKDEIKKGIKDLKENFTNRCLLSLNCWIVGCVIMTISSILISFIIKQNVSTNEALVRESIKIAPLYMLFTCSIMAPLFEELLFRRSLAGLIKNKWLYIIISGLSFGLLHVLGSYNNALDFLYVIPYGAMGCCFAYLFSKSNNITLPIIIHMLHNTILVAVQILGG